jgi:hypothetical protein
MTGSSPWLEDAFFDEPGRGSVDGGTTSAGPLWHGLSPRWGHSLNTMCSYQGMFPAKVAHYFIERFSRPGDTVFDPFSGRGTTALQARMSGRRAICNDLSPLAYVLSQAKVAPPTWERINSWVDDVEAAYRTSIRKEFSAPEDIRMLYHPRTLSQICFLRNRLLNTPITHWSAEAFMGAGALAGIMHGAWRRDQSSQYLSISMPNTFSMAPEYVRTFIAEKGLKQIDQDVFERLRDKLARLYLDEILGVDGQGHHENAVSLLNSSTVAPESVDLVVTSPPYLQVVNYGTANWIRLWLLGVDEVGRDGGVGRRRLDSALDHRHTYSSYREFMSCVLAGIARVLKPNGTAAVVIGDVADPGKDPVPLAAKIWQDIGDFTALRLIDIIEDDLPAQNKVSRIWGETKGQATNRDCILVLAQKGGNPDDAGPEVNWEEPYKDAGPDAAFDRLEAVKYSYT